MPPIAAPPTARILSGPYSKIWPMVQHLYQVDPAIGPVDIGKAQYLYRNCVCTILYQIATKPNIRGELLQSLTDYIVSSKSTSGLESIFLTLLHTAKAVEVTVITSFVKFVENRTKTVVPGYGPMLFYNFEDKTLLRLSDEHASAVQMGHSFGNPLQLSENFGPGAVWVSSNPFKISAPAPAPAPPAAPAPAPAPGPIFSPKLLAPAHHLEVKRQMAAGGPGTTAAQREKAQHEATAGVVGASLGVGAFFLGGTIAALCAAGALAVGLALAVTKLQDAYGLDRKVVQPNQPLPHEDLSRDQDEEGDEGTGDGQGSTSDIGQPEGETEGEGETAGEGEEGEGDGCFPFDTPVLMSDGSFKAIGAVVLGDSVLARTKTGQDESCRVTGLHTSHATETSGLKLSRSMLITTPRQRFSMYEDDKFAAAEALKTGVRLNVRGRKVTTVDMIYTGLPGQEVFNLTVDHAHTYYVGEECVLAHNRKIAGGNEDHGEGDETHV